METKFKFENLIIWQKAMDFGESANELIKKFPVNEKFNLSNQFIRAADSIALNISEGSVMQSNTEFKRFVGYAARSLAECVTCLHKAHRRNYISNESFEEHYIFAFNLMNMIIGFSRKLRS